MKTFLIGLLLIGLTSLGYSQNTNSEDREIKLEAVTVTPLRNSSYINKVQDETTPEPVKELENKASRYDITQSAVFGGDFEEYEVIFELTNGSIIATYDNEGKILSTFEKFKDVLLPPPVRNAVYKEYPGWDLHSDIYRVSYFHNKDVKKMYKVQIKKDDLKKTLKIDTEGKML